MFFHVNFFGKFALFIERSVTYTRRPLFSIYSCNGEYIIDMPYMQIIVTPYTILKHEQVCFVKEQAKGQGYVRREKHREFRQASARASGR